MQSAKMKKLFFILFFILFFFSLSAVVFANDASFGGSGANIFPLEQTDIQLVSEKVVFTETKQGYFVVDARLVFSNSASKPISLKVGFPVEMADDESGRDLSGFKNEKTLVGSFKTWVNEKPAKTNLVAVPKKNTRKQRNWDSVYTFQAKFEPGKETVIRHRYKLYASTSVIGDSTLTYIFQTGGRWKGKIREAVFEYHFQKQKILLMDLNYGFYRKDDARLIGRKMLPTGDFVKKKNLHFKTTYEPAPLPKLTITFRDIKPKNDLVLNYFSPWGINFIFSLPEKDMPMALEKEASEKCTELLQNYIARYKINDELLECYEPALLRNLIYAYYGYPFKQKKWRDLFYKDGLFLPSTVPFDSSWLTNEEKKMIQRLKEKEKNI